MTLAQVLVTLIAVGLVAGLARFFFGSRPVTEAVESAGVQEVRVTVKGGYSPDVIRARTGVPLRIAFDRQEDGDCSARVVFPDLGMSRWLAPFETTVVELTPDRAGTFGFVCGMNMIHGMPASSRTDTRPGHRRTSRLCLAGVHTNSLRLGEVVASFGTFASMPNRVAGRT